MNKLLIVTSLFIIFISACSTKKEIVSIHAKDRNPEYIIRKVSHNEFTFNTLSSKLNINYKDKKNKMSVSANVKIKYDSIIWISITPMLGIEAMRLIITPDSVKFIDKLNKKYINGTYSFLKKIIDVDISYPLLQNILVGNLIVPIQKSDYKAINLGKSYQLSAFEFKNNRKEFLQNNKEDIVIQDLWIDSQNFKILGMTIRSTSDLKSKLFADYFNFKQLGEKIFPSEMTFTVPDESVKIKVEYSKTSIDQQQTFPFSIPSNYKPML